MNELGLLQTETDPAKDLRERERERERSLERISGERES